MRILIISDLYPPYYKGGYELMCEAAVQGLINQGHTVKVLTSRYGIHMRKAKGLVDRGLTF